MSGYYQRRSIPRTARRPMATYYGPPAYQYYEQPVYQLRGSRSATTTAAGAAPAASPAIAGRT